MRIGYGISVAGSNQRNLVSAQAEQVIWKVAIFGAGTASSNGEYIWDGSGTVNGKNIYSAGGNDITWDGFQWALYDDAAGTFYNSDDLISWTIPDDEGGQEPAPSSALSYAQDSFISSLTLIGADPSSSNGTYISNDGIEWNSALTGNYIYINEGIKYLFDNSAQEDMFLASSFPMIWENYGLPAITPPTVSNIIYSA